MGIASANNVDFMIKGVFKFQAFGQELWVTTTEIGLSIVTIVILLIAIVTNVKMKKATEVPGTFQNIIEFAVETLDNMVNGTMGHNAKKFVNYIGTIFYFHIVLQYWRLIWTQNTNRRLWCNVYAGYLHILHYTVSGY